MIRRYQLTLLLVVISTLTLHGQATDAELIIEAKLYKQKYEMAKAVEVLKNVSSETQNTADYAELMLELTNNDVYIEGASLTCDSCEPRFARELRDFNSRGFVLGYSSQFEQIRAHSSYSRLSLKTYYNFINLETLYLIRFNRINEALRWTNTLLTFYPGNVKLIQARMDLNKRIDDFKYAAQHIASIENEILSRAGEWTPDCSATGTGRCSGKIKLSFDKNDVKGFIFEKENFSYHTTLQVGNKVHQVHFSTQTMELDNLRDNFEFNFVTFETSNVVQGTVPAPSFSVDWTIDIQPPLEYDAKQLNIYLYASPMIDILLTKGKRVGSDKYYQIHIPLVRK